MYFTFRHGPPVTTVGAVVPVVAHHEVVSPAGSPAGPSRRGLRNSARHVVVVQRHVVDQTRPSTMRTVSPSCFAIITRLTNHLLRVERVVQHHDIARPRLADLVHEFVDDEAIVVFERHAMLRPSTRDLNPNVTIDASRNRQAETQRLDAGQDLAGPSASTRRARSGFGWTSAGASAAERMARRRVGERFDGRERLERRRLDRLIGRRDMFRLRRGSRDRIRVRQRRGRDRVVRRKVLFAQGTESRTEVVYSGPLLDSVFGRSHQPFPRTEFPVQRSWFDGGRFDDALSLVLHLLWLVMLLLPVGVLAQTPAPAAQSSDRGDAVLCREFDADGDVRPQVTAGSPSSAASFGYHIKSFERDILEGRAT